jgi:hypothetical protein
MRWTAEITRANLKGYTPKGIKALKAQLNMNNKNKDRLGSLDDLNPAINLLYCVYRNEKSEK